MSDKVWTRLQDIADKQKVVVIDFIDDHGYPLHSLMHGLQSKALGRFVVSATKSSKKGIFTKLNPKQSWYFGSSSGDHAIVQGQVDVVELLGNEKLFVETWTEELKQYHHGFDDEQRIILIMNAERVIIDEELVIV